MSFETILCAVKMAEEQTIKDKADLEKDFCMRVQSCVAEEEVHNTVLEFLAAAGYDSLLFDVKKMLADPYVEPGSEPSESCTCGACALQDTPSCTHWEEEDD